MGFTVTRTLPLFAFIEHPSPGLDSQPGHFHALSRLISPAGWTRAEYMEQTRPPDILLPSAPFCAGPVYWLCWQTHSKECRGLWRFPANPSYTRSFLRVWWWSRPPPEWRSFRNACIHIAPVVVTDIEHIPPRSIIPGQDWSPDVQGSLRRPQMPPHGYGHSPDRISGPYAGGMAAEFSRFPWKAETLIPVSQPNPQNRAEHPAV